MGAAGIVSSHDCCSSKLGESDRDAGACPTDWNIARGKDFDYRQVVPGSRRTGKETDSESAACKKQWLVAARARITSHGFAALRSVPFSRRECDAGSSACLWGREIQKRHGPGSAL